MVTEDPRLRADALLLANLKAALPALEELLTEVTGHWTYEDLVYRYYHNSFKVYWLQEVTLKIVAALKALMPERELNKAFLQILADGTGKKFEMEHNQRWPEVTRPIVEAFFHAKYFLEMGVKYGRELDEATGLLPSGWAGFLYLYNMR